MQKYKDEQHNIISVAIVLHPHGLRWTSHQRSPTDEYLGILKNRFLPYRRSPEAAQADLDAYAKRKGWILHV